jgi:hypothetical protein
MADYFMQLKQFDKAVDLLAAIDRVCFSFVYSFIMTNLYK